MPRARTWHRQRCHRQGLGSMQVFTPKVGSKKPCPFPPSLKHIISHVCTSFLHCPQDFPCSASLRALCNQHRVRALGTTTEMMPSTTSASTCRRLRAFPLSSHSSAPLQHGCSGGLPWEGQEIPPSPLFLPPARAFLFKGH